MRFKRPDVWGYFWGFLCMCWPFPLGLTERSACRVDQISGAYGWWGERTLFLTSLHSCRTENYVPGLHLLTFHHPRNDSQPDQVRSPNVLILPVEPVTTSLSAYTYSSFLPPILHSSLDIMILFLLFFLCALCLLTSSCLFFFFSVCFG